MDPSLSWAGMLPDEQLTNFQNMHEMQENL